jgi:hypothetical protein
VRAVTKTIFLHSPFQILNATPWNHSAKSSKLSCCFASCSAPNWYKHKIMTVYLTREQIVSLYPPCLPPLRSLTPVLYVPQIECTGVQHFETLVDLEILFTSFEEFGSLEGCTHLKRLSCKSA